LISQRQFKELIEYTETESPNGSSTDVRGVPETGARSKGQHLEPARATGVATSVSSEAASGSTPVPVASSTEPASGVSPESSGSYSYAPLYAPVGGAPSSGSIGGVVRVVPATRSLLASPAGVSRARGDGVYLTLAAGVLLVLACAGIFGRRGRIPSRAGARLRLPPGP